MKNKLDDKIIPRKLEGIGFNQYRNGDYSFETDNFELFVSWDEHGEAVVMITANLTELPNVKTFTDLKQLIKLLKG